MSTPAGQAVSETVSRTDSELLPRDVRRRFEGTLTERYGEEAASRAIPIILAEFERKERREDYDYEAMRKTVLERLSAFEETKHMVAHEQDLEARTSNPDPEIMEIDATPGASTGDSGGGDGR